MVDYLKELTSEQLHHNIVTAVRQNYLPKQNILTYYSHMVGTKAFIFSNLINKDDNLGIVFKKELTNINNCCKVARYGENNSISLLKIIEVDDYINDLYSQIFHHIDFESELWTDYSSSKKPIIWLENLYIHDIYHRGQIGHLLAQSNIGTDLSKFDIYFFK